MAAIVLTDALVLANGANLSGQTNKLELSAEVPPEDVTTYASGGWREVIGGVGTHEWSLGGWWAAGDAAKPDDRLWSDLGTVAAWTAAVPSAEGSVAYLGRLLSGSHSVGGEVGAVAPYTARGVGSGRIVRGTLVHPAGTARTSTGSGTAFQLGALSASQLMSCALHVCSVAGTTPSLTVRLRSSTSAGGTYNDRITFNAANTVSSQLGIVAGAVADTWWRAEWTISGTTPSFLFAVAAGISAA